MLPPSSKNNSLIREYLASLTKAQHASSSESEATAIWNDAQTTKVLDDGIYSGPELPCFAEGKELGGLKIVENIGVGGMSRVYGAVDTSGQRFAIKMPLIGSDWAFDQIKREFRVARSVTSRSRLSGGASATVQMDRLLEHDGIPCLVERYIAGQCADAWIREDLRPGELPCLDRVYKFVDGMLLALQQMEDASVIHRDIKPSNVLIDESGNVKLIDFGLATWCKMLGAWTSPIVQPGTFRYLAPEAVLGPVVGYAADMYSFGRTLCFLLMGRLPYFDLPTDRDWDQNRINAMIRDQLPSQTPSDLVDLCVDLQHFNQFMRPTPAELGAPQSSVHREAADFVKQAEVTRLVKNSFSQTANSCGRMLVIPYEAEKSEPPQIDIALESIRSDDGLMILKSDVSSDEEIPLRAIDPLLSSLGQWVQYLDPELRKSWPLAKDSTIEKVSPVLGAMLPSIGDLDQTTSFNGAKERGLVEVVDLLCAIARDRVLVLCIENIHQSDELSWIEIEAITKRLGEHSILIVATVDAGNTQAMQRLAKMESANREMSANGKHGTYGRPHFLRNHHSHDSTPTKNVANSQ